MPTPQPMPKPQPIPTPQPKPSPQPIPTPQPKPSPQPIPPTITTNYKTSIIYNLQSIMMAIQQNRSKPIILAALNNIINVLNNSSNF
jgi:outer membrane biosynthesis protein TonB